MAVGLIGCSVEVELGKKGESVSANLRLVKVTGVVLIGLMCLRGFSLYCKAKGAGCEGVDMKYREKKNIAHETMISSTDILGNHR